MSDIYIVFFFCWFFISLIASNILGRKKRIGVKWGFFFLFFMPLMGIVGLVLSPPIKNLPPENNRDKVPNIIISLILFLSALSVIKRATNPYLNYNEEGKTLLLMGAGVLVLASYYFFSRLGRHRKMYFDQRIDELNNR